jgi:hypothetical protein
MVPFAKGLSLRSSLVAIDKARNIRFASDFLSNDMEALRDLIREFNCEKALFIACGE